MSAPERDVLEQIAERLAEVLRRQDELDARCQRIEAELRLAAVPQPLVSSAALAPNDQPAGPTARRASEHGFQQIASEDARRPIGEAAGSSALRPISEAAGSPPLGPTAAEHAGPPPLGPSEGLTDGRATTRAAERPTFESQVGLQWLNRIGVVTLLLGVAFAYKTAVDNNWIGPGARVVVGIAAAFVTLAIGDVQWRRKHVVFAQGLTGLGVALLYLSFWASFALYQLVPQPIAFGLMIATTIASGLLAMRYGSQAIAVLALLGGYITPIAMATGEPHSVIFLGYVTLLNIATIVLARRRVWPVLELLAAAATAVLYAGWLGATSAATVERPLATVFAGVFYAQLAIGRSRIPWAFAQMFGPIVIAVLWDEPALRVALLLAFALAGLIVAERRRISAAPLWTAIWFWTPALLRMAIHPPAIAVELAGSSIGFAGFFAWIVWAHVKQRRPLGGFDLALLIGHPAAYFAAAVLLFEPAHHAYLGGFALGLTAVYLVLGKLVWNAADPAQDRRPAYLAIAIALICFTAAAPLELTGFWVTIAWAVEGAGLAWLSARLTDARLSTAAGLVLVLATAALATAAQRDAFAEPLALVANLRFAAFAVLAASLFATARLLREPVRSTLAYVVGHVVVLLALGLEIAAWIERSLAEADQRNAITVASSILMAGYAVMLIVLGVARRRARDRVMGLVVLAIVVLKLYGGDVWSLGRGFQVAAFLALGVLLLTVSYLYSRYRSVIGRIWKDEPA